MFSKGQLVFAILFAISFIIVMVFAYRKDLKIHKTYYKGSFWILLSFFIFIGILFLIKTLIKE